MLHLCICIWVAKSLTRPLTKKIVWKKAQGNTFLFPKNILLKILTYYLTNNLGVQNSGIYVKKKSITLSSSDFRFEISTKNCFGKKLLPDAHISKIFSYGTAALWVQGPLKTIFRAEMCIFYQICNPRRIFFRKTPFFNQITLYEKITLLAAKPTPDLAMYHIYKNLVPPCGTQFLVWVG